MMMTTVIDKLRSEKLTGHWRNLCGSPARLRSMLHPSPVLAEQGNFILKLAETPAEVESAQKLRYRVFKEEQGRLAQCTDNIDRDRFDPFCCHLLVVDKPTGKTIGTYRALPGDRTEKTGHFYSEEEFRIEGIDALRHEACEVGRSCVAPEFRSGAVAGLLWSGLAALRRRPRSGREAIRAHYARRHSSTEFASFHYLFGCVSLEETDPAAAFAIYELLKKQGKISPLLKAIPRPGFELDPVLRREVEAHLENGDQLLRQLPPLFKGYLRLGATICGVPAYDRDFGTIDFLILVDMREIPERYARHFMMLA